LDESGFGRLGIGSDAQLTVLQLGPLGRLRDAAGEEVIASVLEPRFVAQRGTVTMSAPRNFHSVWPVLGR
jgi:hypothetical protein